MKHLPGLAWIAMLSLVAWHAASGAESSLKAGVFDPPRQAPDFTLHGSNGLPLQLRHYRGKVVVLGFGFTSCADVCPVTLATLASAARSLAAQSNDVQVVYVTVDPQRDTPEQMKKYLTAFDPRFVGGSGSEAELANVRKEYGIQAEKHALAQGYAYSHSSFTYLIDRKGVLRALMPYGLGPEAYVHDLKILLGER